MVKIIVGNYIPKENEIVVDYSPDCIYQNFMNKLTRVIYAEANNLTKDIIKYIAENATSDVIIVCIDETIIKGMRKSKNLEIIKSEGHSEKINDFELAKIILTYTDRNYLLEYLLFRKPSMFFVLKVLISNYAILNDNNKKCVQFLDRYLWKVDQEMIYHFIATWIKPQPITFLKWNFPKKEDKDAKSED